MTVLRDASRAWVAFAVATAIASSLAAYWGALDGGFLHWDDRWLVAENPNLVRLDGASLHWMLTSLFSGNWLPLTWFSHAVDIAAFGLNPRFHHLSNLLLHAANSALVFWIALRLLSWKAGESAPEARVASAAVVALLFAVHPQHVESVAWISERKDLLCALFSLAAVGLYLSYLRRRTWPWYVAVLGAFAAALMSKPMAVTLPVIFLLLDTWPGERIAVSALRHGEGLAEMRLAVVEKLPMLVASAAVAAVTVLAQAQAESVQDLGAIGLQTRLLNAANSVFAYVAKLLLPLNLLPLYPFPEHVQSLNPRSLGQAAAFVLATCLAVLAAARGSPAVLVGWLAYLVALLPVIGLVQVGIQSAADRYAYLPTIPFYLALGFGIVRLARRNARFWVPVALALPPVLMLAMLTRAQVLIWKDDESLWRHTLERAPDAGYSAWNNLGNALIFKRRFDEAQMVLEAGIDRYPRYLPAYGNLVTLHRMRGRPEEAFSWNEKILAKDPDAEDPLSARAELALELGRFDVAERAFAELLARFAERPEALFGLAVSKLRRGDLAGAREWARRLRDHYPGSRLVAKLPVQLLE